MGIYVTGASINGSGHLILTLSDSSTVDAGAVRPDSATVSATCSETPGTILVTFEDFTYPA
jgi:hypothetical protein